MTADRYLDIYTGIVIALVVLAPLSFVFSIWWDRRHPYVPREPERPQPKKTSASA